LLDGADSLPPSFHSHLIVATQRLAGKSGLFPTCYELDGVTTIGDSPVSDGGFALIYKGSFRARLVCLKVIPRMERATEARVKRWLKDCSKESILWGQLSHPNLLPFYGVYRFKGEVAFVSPWMEHGDVNQYLRQSEHRDANRVLLLLDIARGLQYLHRKGIVHGDLKGRNILVNESGRACVADFGLSSISDINILAWASQSSVASKGGTSRWQAPELLHPTSVADTRNTMASDMYAWSCVAYEIFTGDIPFPHIENDNLVKEEIRKGDRPEKPSASSPSVTKWGLTEDIWRLMWKCWETNRLMRPTVGQVVESLSTMLSSEDLQPAERHTALSPAQFRELTRQGGTHDELTVDVLESVVGLSTTSNTSN
ncbi:kinase-like domain-containing protein, partial [Lyophyllum atratum]